MDLNGYNAEEHEAPDFELVPEGWYKGVIIGTEERETKSGTGSYLMVTLEIIEGNYKGRKFFDRLNLRNKNETAVQIAQRILSSICLAVNVPRPKDSQDLHDIPLMFRVVISPASDGYDASNNIKGYKAVDSVLNSNGTEKPVKDSLPPWKS